MSDEIEELCNAIGDGALPLVQHLIDEGVNLNAQNKEGDIPLSIAIYHRNYKMVELLLKNGAKLDSRDRMNATPLHIAAGVGNLSIMELLLKYNANINIRDGINGSPIFHAIYAANNDIVKLLLDSGADPNIESEEATALTFTSVKGNLAAMEMLLDAGANINARDCDGDTALVCAAKNRYIEIVHLLIKRGANPNVKNKKKKTVYDYCRLDELMQAMNSPDTIIV